MLLLIVLLLVQTIVCLAIQPKNTIILVPGVGGSMVFTKDKTTNEIERCWVRIFYQNTEIEKVLVPYNQSSDTFYSPRYEVVIKPDNYGIYSIYNLDPDLIILTGLVEYFKHFIDHLLELGYEPGKNLFGLPYDWRYSTNRTLVLNQLHQLLTSNKNNIIISHSMGGLIVENYIRQYGNKNIQKWIPVSAPFKGVGGKIFQAFSIGYNLGNPLLKLSNAKNLAYLALATYELFPQQYLDPMPKFGIKDSNITWVNPVHYFQKTDSRFDPKRILNRKCFNTNVDTYYLSTSYLKTPHDTIFDTSYEDVSFNDIEGDGTVPIISALNAKCHNQSNDKNIDLKINSSHFDLIKNTKTIDLIDRIMDVNCKIAGTYENISISDPNTFYHTDGTIRSIQMKNLIVWKDCIHLTDVITNKVYRKTSNEFKVVDVKDAAIVDYNLEGMDYIMCAKGYKLKNNECL